VATGTTRAVTWSVVVAAALTVLTVADVATIRGIEQSAQQFQAAAANVRTLPAPGQIDGQTCERLDTVVTIEAAGAMREIPPLAIDQAPGVPMTAYEVSVGFAQVIGVQAPEPVGVWMEQGLADALQVVPGDDLASGATPVTVAATFAWPQDGRDARLGFAILIPVASADAYFDECWIRAWPIAEENDGFLRSTVVASQNSAFGIVAQLNRNYGTTLDANALFHERLTRHVALLAPFICFALGFVTIRIRRLEYASSLHAGQPRGALLLGATTETVVWALTGAAVTLVVDAAAIRWLHLGQMAPAWLTCARVVCWSLVATILGAITSASLVREKHLFRLFRIR
jgi:hypothetical protein